MCLRRHVHVLGFLLLLVGATIEAVAGLRFGSDWGDDFAQYIGHARSIVEGRPYAEWLYICCYSTQVVEVGPRIYPPGTSILISPVYALFSGDLLAIKAYLVVIFALSAWAYYFVAREVLGRGLGAVIAAAALALSPYRHALADTVLSEFPFMLFLYGGLLLCLRGRNAASLGARVAVHLLAAALLFCCIATRPIGFVLLPALLLADVLCLKRLRVETVLLVVAVAALYVLLIWVPGLNTDYGFKHKALGLGDVLASIGFGIRSFSHAVPIDNSIAQSLVTLMLIGGAAVGLVDTALRYLMALRARQAAELQAFWGSIVLALFAGAYIAAVVLSPVLQSFRYYFPILPIVIILFMLGVRAICRSVPRAGRWTVAVAAVFWACAYAPSWAKVSLRGGERAHIVPGLTATPTREFLGFVRASVPPEAVMVFQKPRLLAVYGERRAAPWPPRSDPGYWDYFRGIGATHLVVAKPAAGITSVHTPPDLARHAGQLLPVFDNAYFTVFEQREVPP